MEPRAIRALRIRMLDSQEQFGRRLGVTGHTVSGWETGQHRPCDRVLMILRRWWQREMRR